MALTVTFHGVRGSSPCHGPETSRYGGNTSCVSVHAEGERPLLFDLGTGLRYFGHQHAMSGEPLDAVALVTHMHWDHIQGLPFFAPMLCSDARLSIYGPHPGNGKNLAQAMRETISPPTFPVTLADFAGRFDFFDVADCDFSLGGYSVKSRVVPHVGPTVGYRIELGGASVAYISDHQQPLDDRETVSAGVRELAEDVDLLIHDSQYTAEEFGQKSHWGHCTAEYAIAVAASTRARRVVLYHHDPERTDAQLDRYASCMAQATGPQVIVAREGMSLSL